MLAERGNDIIRYEKVISFAKYLFGMILVAYGIFSPLVKYNVPDFVDKSFIMVAVDISD